jgi:hypothetical protein
MLLTMVCDTLKIRELRRMRRDVHAVHMGEKFVQGFGRITE